MTSLRISIIFILLLNQSTRAYSKKGTFQIEHIPKRAHSKKGTFQKGHIPKRAHAHWTYWLQIYSKLCFQRVALSGNYKIVAISNDKNTFFNGLDYKADIGQHFHRSEKSARVSKDVPGSTKHAS